MRSNNSENNFKKYTEISCNQTKGTIKNQNPKAITPKQYLLQIRKKNELSENTKP